MEEREGDDDGETSVSYGRDIRRRGLILVERETERSS